MRRCPTTSGAAALPRRHLCLLADGGEPRAGRAGAGNADAGFAPHDPREIHRHSTPEETAAVLAKLKPQFIHHPESQEAHSGDHGRTRAATCEQTLLRRAAHADRGLADDYLTSGIAYAFHPHRDTWYSAPACQLNWWMPIYPWSPENAMAFHPRYFDEPVKNSSRDLQLLRVEREEPRDGGAACQSDTREQPKAAGREFDPSPSASCPPGRVCCFSGAQLHETVPNTTGCLALQHRLPHRASRRRRWPARCAQRRFRAARARRCATTCGQRPEHCRMKSSGGTTTAPR